MQVVGLRDMARVGLAFAGLTHGARLAQAAAVRLRLHGTRRRDCAYMQLDGEPWRQPVPAEDSGEALQVSLSSTPCVRCMVQA